MQVFKIIIMVICIGKVIDVYKRDMILHDKKRQGMKYDIAWHSKDFVREHERPCGLRKQGKNSIAPVNFFFDKIYENM